VRSEGGTQDGTLRRQLLEPVLALDLATQAVTEDGYVDGLTVLGGGVLRTLGGDLLEAARGGSGQDPVLDGPRQQVGVVPQKNQSLTPGSAFGGASPLIGWLPD
jgi:hypothetical protein